MEQNVVLEMRDISKNFTGVRALSHVDFTLRKGEIHALMGENGAGKSTLIKVLTGVHEFESGSIHMAGNSNAIVNHSPQEAQANGISTVYQEVNLCPNLTVAENLFIGREPRKMGMIDWKQMNERSGKLLESLDIHVPPTQMLEECSIAIQQMIAIARAVDMKCRVLILDEPTAVLTPQETRELFVNLRKMADDGCAVVFISHKLNEVEELADRVTVLRGGCVTGSAAKEDMHRDKLVQMMIGREVLNTYEKNCEHCGEVVLQLEQVSALNDMNTVGLNNVRLAVRAGEIYGIAGVSGNGQRELAEVLAGLRPAMGGKIFFYGQDLTNKKPKEMIEAGISYVPEDRLGMGLVPNLDSVNNVILKEYDGKFSKGWRIRREAAIAATKRIVEDFDVKLGSIFQPVKMMSGGNLQKLLLGREIAAKPKLMIVLYPVRGLDIGAIEAVHKLLLQLKEEQTAIILVSEELEEIAKLADRVGVMFAGQILGEFPVSEMDTEKIGALMAGITEAGGAGV